MQKQRLELDWIGKDEVVRLEPRVLIRHDFFGSEDGRSNSLNSLRHSRIFGPNFRVSHLTAMRPKRRHLHN